MSLWEIVKEEIPDPLDDLPDTTVPISEAEGNFTFTYEGVDINFPYNAYTSQQEMMQKIIEGVNRSEHCLLESPTGTGKTAALLCALLAWQKFDVERQTTYISPKRFKLNLQDTPDNDNQSFDHNEEDGETSKYFRPQLQPSCEGSNDGHNFDGNEEDGETSKYFRSQSQPKICCEGSRDLSLADQPTQIISNAHLLTQKCSTGHNRTVPETPRRMVRRKLFLDPSNTTVDNLDNTDTVNTSNLNSTLSSSKSSESDPEIRTGKPEKPVTIYYASRTHSQIKNVVNQLKQTKYSNTPMLILASRTQTCINSVATEHENGVDEMCEKLRNPPSRKSKSGSGESPPSPAPTCGYFGTREKFVSFPSSRNYTPWDIEDIQEYGRGCGSCPYYGIKALQEKARIVFCHYNHLLHGNIRRASKINIDSKSILVFDEAHNIEELCMNIASKNITLEAIDLIRLEFDEAMKGSRGSYGDIPGWKRPALQHLTVALKRLSNWLARQRGTDDGFRKVYDSHGTVTKSTKDLTSKVIETFSNVGFGPDDLSGLWRAYFVMENKSQKCDATGAAFRIKAKHMRKLNSLLYVLNFLFKRNRKPTSDSDQNTEEYEYVRLDDFKVFLVKLNNSNLELHLRCLNPAVAFEEMKPARTVIVTSGTLSPIASFSSELQMDFKHVLSASHVLGPDRIFSAVITKMEESSSKELDFSYGSLNKKPLPNYEHHQLELGNILLEVSKKVQYGLLVFGSSKFFMAKLKKSWRKNGVLKKLKKIKDVYFEHDTSTGPQFNEMHALYRESTRSPRGAVLFGFLRGRASEGVDFKDNEARVVLTIGIPFLPFKEEAIVAKRAYNDKKLREEKSPKTRISGQEWYNGTAFRTLNQAFGRCVRHSEDWGIILILDSRVRSPSYTKYLSAWVKESMDVIGRSSVGSLQTVIPQLTQFLQHLADSSGSGSCYSC